MKRKNRDLKNSKLKSEREIYKKYRIQYLLRRQNLLEVSNAIILEIKQHKEGIKRAQRQVKFYQKTIETLEGFKFINAEYRKYLRKKK